MIPVIVGSLLIMGGILLKGRQGSEGFQSGGSSTLADLKSIHTNLTSIMDKISQAGGPIQIKAGLSDDRQKMFDLAQKFLNNMLITFPKEGVTDAQATEVDAKGGISSTLKNQISEYIDTMIGILGPDLGMPDSVKSMARIFRSAKEMYRLTNRILNENPNLAGFKAQSQNQLDALGAFLSQDESTLLQDLQPNVDPATRDVALLKMQMMQQKAQGALFQVSNPDLAVAAAGGSAAAGGGAAGGGAAGGAAGVIGGTQTDASGNTQDSSGNLISSGGGGGSLLTAATGMGGATMTSATTGGLLGAVGAGLSGTTGGAPGISQDASGNPIVTTAPTGGLLGAVGGGLPGLTTGGVAGISQDASGNPISSGGVGSGVVSGGVLSGAAASGLIPTATGSPSTAATQIPPAEGSLNPPDVKATPVLADIPPSDPMYPLIQDSILKIQSITTIAGGGAIAAKVASELNGSTSAAFQEMQRMFVDACGNRLWQVGEMAASAGAVAQRVKEIFTYLGGAQNLEDGYLSALRGELGNNLTSLRINLRYLDTVDPNVPATTVASVRGNLLKARVAGQLLLDLLDVILVKFAPVLSQPVAAVEAQPTAPEPTAIPTPTASVPPPPTEGSQNPPDVKAAPILAEVPSSDPLYPLIQQTIGGVQSAGTLQEAVASLQTLSTEANSDAEIIKQNILLFKDVCGNQVSQYHEMKNSITAAILALNDAVNVFRDSGASVNPADAIQMRDRLAATLNSLRTNITQLDSIDPSVPVDAVQAVRDAALRLRVQGQIVLDAANVMISNFSTVSTPTDTVTPQQDASVVLPPAEATAVPPAPTVTLSPAEMSAISNFTPTNVQSAEEASLMTSPMAEQVSSQAITELNTLLEQFGNQPIVVNNSPQFTLEDSKLQNQALPAGSGGQAQIPKPDPPTLPSASIDLSIPFPIPFPPSGKSIPTQANTNDFVQNQDRQILKSQGNTIDIGLVVAAQSAAPILSQEQAAGVLRAIDQMQQKLQSNPPPETAILVIKIVNILKMVYLIQKEAQIRAPQTIDQQNALKQEIMDQNQIVNNATKNNSFDSVSKWALQYVAISQAAMRLFENSQQPQGFRNQGREGFQVSSRLQNRRQGFQMPPRMQGFQMPVAPPVANAQNIPTRNQGFQNQGMSQSYNRAFDPLLPTRETQFMSPAAAQGASIRSGFQNLNRDVLQNAFRFQGNAQGFNQR